MERVREVTLVFTTLLTGLDASSNRCYVCTTIDANAMLEEIVDPNWRRWLENVRHAPYSEHCADDFKVDLALRGGVKNYECNHGVCMKMVIQQESGMSYVWRSCLSQTKKEIKQDCTRVSSSEGDLGNCTECHIICEKKGEDLLLSEALQENEVTLLSIYEAPVPSGNLEVCTCSGNLCNNANKYAVISSFLVVLIYRSFVHGF